jgi:2-haloacid dehalogenase
MATTLAFDVYGTLIDTHGVKVALEQHAGPRAMDFSLMWREKQLEYSFRRGLMQNYETFAVCTRQALDYTCAVFGMPLGEADKEKLLAAYRTLPAFKEVNEGLALARKAGFRLFAFSNGSAEAVETLLQAAGIREHFLDVVSVDEVKSFKPNPGVYAHFLRRAGATGADAWLISGNPFDVLGAMSAGMRAVWVKRSPEAIFDHWGIAPNLIVSDLLGVASQIELALKNDRS